jgi:hypothetical protein
VLRRHRLEGEGPALRPSSPASAADKAIVTTAITRERIGFLWAIVCRVQLRPIA